jgi:hypothetical protein
MFTLKNLIKLFVSGTLLFSLSNCASATYTSRYKKPVTVTIPSPVKKNRFTAKEIPMPKETDTVSVFHDSLSINEIEEFDELPVEDFPVDKEAFLKSYKYIEKLSNALTDRDKMLFEIIKFLDTPYKYGGNDLRGIDCSGFTQNVFSSSIGYTLPRSAREQFKIGDTIDSNSLEFGDLVFFNTRRRSNPGHVGIYLGDDLFAHASSSLGVSISSLKSTYYNKRYVGGRRIKQNYSVK